MIELRQARMANIALTLQTNTHNVIQTAALFMQRMQRSTRAQYSC